MKIEIGRYYKNRLGAIYGPVEECDGPRYPYEANGECFTEDGKWSIEGVSNEDLIEDVTHLFEPKQPFPTLEEVRKYASDIRTITAEDFYTFFATKMTITEFPKVGERYEFSDDGVKWYERELTGFCWHLWQHIRPIQPDPKQEVIKKLKNLKNNIIEDKQHLLIQDLLDVIEPAIKALEESK